MIRLSNLSIPLGHDENWLLLAASALKLPARRIESAQLSRKSVDARDKMDIHFVVSLDIALRGGETEEQTVVAHFSGRAQARLVKAQEDVRLPRATLARRPVVVGLGPAGLFAAYALAQAGCRPIVLERGMDVARRARAVASFWAGGALDEQTNVQFGEGGAGAFSDGKLVSGTHDPRAQTVRNLLCQFGAPEEIAYLAKPHIGTDRLPAVVKAMREKIVALGGEVRFECALTGIEAEDGRICGLALRTPKRAEESLATDDLILAIGHSARDTFEMLHRAGLPMEAKPFSIGARIEHAQRAIDQVQYGATAAHPRLGAAEYKLSVRLADGRGAYTFCMCPGGRVIAAASERGHLVVNGMSAYARDGENANSALLVDVRPSDFGADDPLAGIRFQRLWEKRAFELGGGAYRAPAQLVGDFLRRVPSTAPGDIAPTYLPGVVYASLDDCLPAFVTEAMRAALVRMDRQLKGFAAPGAILTGVETRSSSPVRIVRGPDCQAALSGLYPCGEGAGYAGGILSAAVDGLRCAEALLRNRRVEF